MRKPRFAHSIALSPYKKLYLATLSAYAVGKNGPFVMLGHLNELLAETVKEARRNPRLRDVFNRLSKTLLDEIPALFESVYEVTQKSESRYDEPFLLILDRVGERHTSLVSPAYREDPESIGELIQLLEDYRSITARSLSGLPIMIRFVASEKPIELAKKLNRVILRALTKYDLWGVIQPIGAPREEEDALAALMGGLAVEDGSSPERLRSLFGQGIQDWGGARMNCVKPLHFFVHMWRVENIRGGQLRMKKS